MAPLTRAQLTRHIRDHVACQLYDESGGPADLLVDLPVHVDAPAVAIYSLSDPRDIRQVRYVGQSSAPLQCLEQQLPLHNVETEVLRRQQSPAVQNRKIRRVR